MSSTAIYNKIGKTYDFTRRADPEILSRLIQHLSPNKDLSYLDVGCGSGNYTEAIFKQGFQITGIDISEEMLRKAKLKNDSIDWIYGDARNMPFLNDSFNGATCVLATHHIKDIEIAFREVFRVIKNGSFVIFTAFPEQMKSYWLNQYFPKMMQKAQRLMASSELIAEVLFKAGFHDIKIDKFFVTKDLQDWFLHAGKYRPEIYLDPQVRAGISTFAIEDNFEEIKFGCRQLQDDIISGYIKEVITSYESELGDYAFIVGHK
ncbi:MAG TPA: class I SAM-dependent methyltransferase [Parachlamydiaceae bacterium]|nr:class I SAM-dependent methyltransferase [Parachlamydiaceae bacterium]